MKSAASTAWPTHKDFFSVPDTKLFTDSYSAPNTLVLPASKNRKPNQAAASVFSCRSGDCGSLVRLHPTSEDSSTLSDWLQISNTKGWRFFNTYPYFVCSDMPSLQSTESTNLSQPAFPSDFHFEAHF